MTDGEELKEEEAVVEEKGELTEIGVKVAEEPLTAQRGMVGLDEG